MTVTNIEKYFEAVNPHIQVSPHMFYACAARKKILRKRNSVIFITVKWRPPELQYIVGRPGKSCKQPRRLCM